MILRVRDWETRFERNRTRELRRATWVAFPNDLSTELYSGLVDAENGAARFGVWVALMLLASRCEPQRGDLVRENGLPHDAKTIARVTRMDRGIVDEVIRFLVEFGELQQITATNSQLHAVQSHDSAPIPHDSAVIAHDYAEKAAYITEQTVHTVQDRTPPHLPGVATFHDWVQRQYERHPKKKTKILAEQELARLFGNATEAERERFQEIHAAWCATPAWREKNGQFVPPLAEWLRDDGHKAAPEEASDYSPNGRLTAEEIARL